MAAGSGEATGAGAGAVTGGVDSVLGEGLAVFDEWTTEQMRQFDAVLASFDVSAFNNSELVDLGTGVLESGAYYKDPDMHAAGERARLEVEAGPGIQGGGEAEVRFLVASEWVWRYMRVFGDVPEVEEMFPELRERILVSYTYRAVPTCGVINLRQRWVAYRRVVRGECVSEVVISFDEGKGVYAEFYSGVYGARRVLCGYRVWCGRYYRFKRL